MKKIFLSLILSLTLLVNVSVAFAADDYVRQGKCQVYVKDSVASLFPTSFCSAGDFVTVAVKTLLGLISLIAVVVIVLGGYKYVTSQGNSEAAGQARKSITNAVVGLVISVLAYTIVTVVSNTVGSTGGGPAAPSANPSPSTQNQRIASAKANLALATSFIEKTIPASNGNPSYTQFLIRIKPDPADLSVLCSGSASSGTATVSVSIPLQDGEDPKIYTSGAYGIDVNGQNTTDIVDFNTQNDPIPSNRSFANGPTLTVQINLDNGCSTSYTLDDKGGI